MNDEFEPIGEVRISSGQLMLCDPANVKNEWIEERPAAPMLLDLDGNKFYCTCHGPAPAEDAVPFDNYNDILPCYGDTVNNLVKAGLILKPAKRDRRTEFSYVGCCKSTFRMHAGLLHFKDGTPGIGVALSLGGGHIEESCPVHVRRDTDGRIIEVRILMNQQPTTT